MRETAALFQPLGEKSGLVQEAQRLRGQGWQIGAALEIAKALTPQSRDVCGSGRASSRSVTDNVFDAWTPLGVNMLWGQIVGSRQIFD